MCRQERFKSTGMLRAEWQIQINTRISDSMVNHKLLSRGIRARRPTRTLFLTQTRRESALSGHTSIAPESYVIKEMWYSLINPGFSCIVAVVVSKYGVQIKQDSRKTVLPQVAHGRGSMHFWCAIHYGGHTDLVVLDANLNSDSCRHALETEMVPYVRRHFGNNFLLQHDNVPVHRARRI